MADLRDEVLAAVCRLGCVDGLCASEVARVLDADAGDVRPDDVRRELGTLAMIGRIEAAPSGHEAPDDLYVWPKEGS